MKKTLLILTLAMMSILAAIPAHAAHVLSGAGDIVVDIQNELGQTLNSASVDLRLPGADGALDVGFDTVITHVDGVTVGGTADGDGTGADGDVEYLSTNPSANYGGNIANGEQFRITVALTGYVTYIQDYSWSAVALNTKTSANKFTVKVVLREQLGNTVTGGQVVITGGLTAVDGAANDADGAANGAIYIAQNPTGPGTPASAAFTEGGYLNYSDNTQSINANSQTVYTTAFQYPFKITAQDELANALTLVATNATMGGTLTQAGLKDSGGTLYYAATGGPGTISLTYGGFVTSTAAGPFTFNAAGAAATVTFQAAGDGAALTYTLHVLGLTDELGSVVAIGGATFGSTGFSITSQTISGGVGYVAATPAVGNLTAIVSGYVTGSQAVTPSIGGMQTIDFDDAAQYAGVVDGPALQYAFKISSIQEELSNALVVGAGDTVNLYTDSNCTATATYVSGPTFNAANWYAAVATGTYYAKYTQTGYVARCSVVSYAHTAAAQMTPAFTVALSQPLLYAIKVVVNDELGSTVSGLVVTDLTIGGSNATQVNSNSMYYALAAAGAAASVKTGYAAIDTAVDTQLASVTPGTATQTVVTLTGTTACATGGSISAGSTTTCKGLRFGIKVNVSDELGNALTGVATGEVLIGGSAAAAVSGTALYYNTGSGALTSSKVGFVNAAVGVDTQIATVNTGTTGQTTVSLTGTVACGAGASIAANAAVTCRGLFYAVRVNVSDELGTAINTMAVSDITINSSNAAYASTNALYYQLSAAGVMAGGKSGFINVNTATDTQLASVNPGVTSQTVINLTGVVACATGGSIAANATVTCNGLDYGVKMTAAQEELGNALVLAGADTFNVYTDAACSATATYVAGPTFGGGAWYAAVANGTYYAKYTQSGYVTTCSTATVVAAQAGPTANPSFTAALGNGLKFAIKIMVYDELGSTVAGLITTDLTVGGSNATQVNSNSMYYALAAAGAAASVKTGYAGIDTAVDTQLVSVTPGSSSQTVVILTGTTACATGASVTAGSATTCKGLRFGIKVVVSDELGNALAPAVTEVLVGGSSAAAVSGSSLYYNTGSGALTSSKSGYVNAAVAVDTQIATVNTGTTGQTVVTLTGTTACAAGASIAANAAATCRGLLFAVKVNVSDELGTAITPMTVSDITINGSSANYASASAMYYALTAAGVMAGGKSGFINVNTATDTQLASVNPGVTSQTVVNLTGAVACAAGGSIAANATVTCNGLDYGVKMTAAQEELGNALVLAGADTFNVYTDAACSATATYVAGPTFSGAAWYAAVANGTYYAKYTQSGYVTTCSTATVVAAQAGPTANPSFTAALGNGLKFAIKIMVYDELGSTVAGLITTDLTVGGSNATQVNSNSMYYALAAAGAAASVKTGYAAIDTAVDTQLVSVTPGSSSQTVVILTGTTACATGASVTAGSATTCKGLRFGIKVVVSDELGNALAPAVTEVLVGGSSAAAVSGSSLYYNTGTGALTSSKSGYVNAAVAVDTQIATVNTGTTGQTVVTLTGTTACAAGASIAANAAATCRGLLFAVKVNVSDELGTAITPMTVSDITINGSSANYASASAMYYALTAAGVMAGGKSGFINVNTATDTQLASVNPGVTSQTVVNLTGAVACAAGGSIAANATVTCNGLDYGVMMTAAQEELGNALVLAGADTFNVYTDAACSATATYVAGPTFSGAAWYAAVATGTYYPKYTKSGYVPRCSTATVGTTAAVTVNPTFTAASGNGLLYAVKIVVKDELAATVAGMLAADITIGGGAATQVNSNSLYYALAASGAVAGGHTGYVNIDTAVDTQLASVAPGVSTQTLINLTGTTACATGATVSEGATVSCDGLKYGIKVNVSDEVGTAMAPLTTEVTIGGSNAATVVGNALYYNTGTGIMASSKSGYVNVSTAVDTQLTSINTGTTAQTVVNLTGTTACSTGASITQGTTVACDGLKFAVKVSVSDELAAALTTMAVTDITINGSNASYATSSTLYYALTAAGVMAGGKSGYINVNIATDTQLAIVNPGVLAQTVVNLTGTVPCAAGGNVAAGGTVTCDGLAYTVKLTVSDEFGTALTMAVTDFSIGGTNAAVASANTLYYSVTAAGALAGGKTGYINVSTASDTQIASVTPGTTGQTRITITGAGTCSSGASIGAGGAVSCSGLKFNVKFLYVQDEAAGAITPIVSDEAKLFTDSGCTSEATYLTAPFFNGGAWYASVNPSVSYYGRFGRAGYVNTCDATAINVTAAGPQFMPNFVATDNDGLKFAVKAATVQDELGNTITMDGSETVGLYTDSLCTVAGPAPIAGPTWYATAKTWNIAQAAGGTYYTKLSKNGYVNRCDANAISTASTTQALPLFQAAGLDGLQYGLKVVVNDEFGAAVTGVTITHNGSAPVFANQGASLNTYYFNTAVVGQMLLSKTGYIDIDSGAASVTPGGGAVGQTYITLTGTTNGPLGVVAGGASATRDGMKAQTNVKIAVVDVVSNTGITGLGNTGNFYFTTSGGARVTPTYFVEPSPLTAPGVYQIKVATSAAFLQIKDVDDDTDPWIDYEDSTNIALTGLTTTLVDFGTATMYPKADYVQLISDGTLEATGTEVITAVMRDNDGATITTGSNATRTITFTISGGSVSPASLKDITATSLVGATSVAGSGDLTVTGQLTNGTATITISDSLVGDGTNILASVAPTTGTLSQDFSTNTANLSIDVVYTGATKISVIAPSYALSADNEFPVTFEVQDTNGNLVTTAANTFTASLSGSAKCKSSSVGIVTTCSGSSNITGSVAGGKATVNIQDTKAESITISFLAVSGGLTMGTANLTIVPGTPTKLSLAATPSTTVAGTASSLSVSVLDANNNVVSTSTAQIALTASGNAKFSTATVGTLVSGVNSSSAAVNAAAGLVTLPINDTTAQSVTVTATDPGAVLTSTSTTVVFSPGTGNKLVLLTAAQTQTAGQVAATAYAVQVQDSNGNPLVAVPAAVTVNLSSTSTGTVTYHTTSGGSAVTSLTISTATDSAVFYYKDTKAGAPTITLSGTGLTPATLLLTVNPASPVSGVVITTTSAADVTQPTGMKTTQTAAGLGGSLAILEYTYTADTSVTLQVTADGSTRAKVLVYVKDTYGNARMSDAVVLANTNSLTGLTITPTSQTTNSAGLAQFEVTSTGVGTATFQVTVGGATAYGNSFSIAFKTADRTPPTISTTASAYTLVNGDAIGSIDPIIIKTSLTDPGTNPSGVDLASIQVTVKNSAGTTMVGVTSTSGCSLATSCEVRWTPTAALAAGQYTITFTVADMIGNLQTQTWTAHVSSSNTFENVAAGAPGDGIFNPLSGGSMTVSFQSPGVGTVVMEIYRRDGRLIYTSTSAVTAGYNQMLWDGRTSAGTYAANGIYVFRLKANLTTGTVEQTGKLALFKR